MSRFLDALHCRSCDRPPVWLMRQAGRYLPEYRAIREKVPLEQMFTSPDIAAQITMQPIDRFGFDAAILFADILTPCAGFDLNVTFEGGPKVCGDWKAFDIAKVHHVQETIGILKRELKVPLIGFCGGPLTVAKYIEGPVDMKALTDASIDYLKMQIAAGVDAVQIFDSWSGLLPKEQFLRDALPHLKRMVEAIHPFPVILFTRGSCHLVNELAMLGPRGISFDWDRPMQAMRSQVPGEMVVQGNLDPALLKQPKRVIEQELSKLLESMRDHRGFILNVGHGLTPDTPVDGVQAMMDTLTT